MSILSAIGGLFEPVTKLADELFTTDEERNAHKEKLMDMKAGLMQIQAGVIDKVLDYESRLTEAQTKIIVAEAQGQSWLQRNWRPILMLSIVAIVVNNYLLQPWLAVFGITAPVLQLPDDLWGLMKIGVGGYVVGRSAEKIVPQIVEVMKSKEKT